MYLSDLPPIVFIVSGIIAITGINIVNRLAIKSFKTRWGVIAANYCVALILSVVLYANNGFYPISLFTITLGIVSGILYIGGMYLGITTIGRRGASIAVSASQLSVLIPVSLSVVIFGDSLSATQVVGVGVALISLPLLAAKVGGLNSSLDRETLLLIVVQLMVQGLAQFTSKILVASGYSAEREAYFFIVYCAATLMTIPVALMHRSEIRLNDYAYGGVVGVCNIGVNLSTLIALTLLPGAIVYPLVNSGGLLLVTILAWFLFKEKISRINALGIAFTLVAVLLINL